MSPQIRKGPSSSHLPPSKPAPIGGDPRTPHQSGVHVKDFSKSAAANHLLEVLKLGPKSKMQVQCKDAVGFGGRFNHLFTVGQGRCERLLAENMCPDPQCLYGDGSVKRVRNSDGNCVRSDYR